MASHGLPAVSGSTRWETEWLQGVCRLLAALVVSRRDRGDHGGGRIRTCEG